MGKVISLVNQKGGVGKTTTSINLSASLAALGKKVLLIDLDPQGNTTTGVGINKGDIERSIYDVLIDKCNINDAMIKTKYKNLYVIPATINLAGLDIELLEKSQNEPGFSKGNQLKNHLELVKDNFDFVIIDCPPSLNMLTVNAMTTADTVLVPIQCEYYALEGLSQLIHTINLVQERLNPDLQIEGVVFTMYDVRTNLSNQVVETVKDNLDTKIYNTMIPRNIRLAEAPSYGIPINLYDSKSAGAESYRNLAAEIIERKDL